MKMTNTRLFGFFLAALVMSALVTTTANCAGEGGDGGLSATAAEPDDEAAPAEPVAEAEGAATSAYQSGALHWSHAGAIGGMNCKQILEVADPDTWGDNYLCSNVDYGIQWSSAGPIAGMRCTQTLEIAEPASHTWTDNYICVPTASTLTLSWSMAGRQAGKSCVQWSEPADPHTWGDNFLCYTGSCSNRCGASGGGCWCDSQCTTYGDCCSDFTSYCVL